MQTLGQKNTKSKYIVLWAAPRCVSTAFEKTFSCRSDTKVVHEPFCYVYYFSQWRRSTRFGECKELWDYSSDKAIEKINLQQTPLVFVKDHCSQALPYIERSFLESKINTFIIRDPEEVLASWYRVNEFPTEEEFGFTALEQMWKIVTEELGQTSVVIDANRFRQQPENVLRRYCQKINVEFDSQMLSWEDGKVQNWNAREAELHQKWQAVLNNSKTIMSPVQYTSVKFLPEHIEMLEKAWDIFRRLQKIAL